jgi:exodeoxyribonuclease-3
MTAVRETRILCWNVNGVRAARRAGLLAWLDAEAPDILCLQETKATPDQLDDELKEPPGYHSYWNYPERKGYGGVATLYREEPDCVRRDFGPEGFDTEGRALVTEYREFTLLNVYFPNGKKDETRLRYKLDFYDTFLDYIEGLRAAGRKLIICGDFNTAHHEIDLARPKENAKVSGFLPIERAWLDRLVGLGYVDTFRHFCGEPGQYTWWDVKTKARERNVGWRLDYFFVSADLLPPVSRAFIMPEVTGSDHCPVGLVLKTP